MSAPTFLESSLARLRKATLPLQSVSRPRSLGAEGDAQRLDTLVTGLVSKKPDVIIALTSPAVLALKQAGVVTPVVFAFVTDPVRQGIVASLAHPGGNFTGVTYSEATLGGKRLDLLLDALPGTRHIAVIWSRSFSENAAIFDVIRQAAQARGVEVFPKELEGVQEDGGLMSYGPDLGESYRGTAALADKVLKGAHPADLPVEEPTQFSLCINLKTAKALGLTIPPMFLARADQVIE